MIRALVSLALILGSLALFSTQAVADSPITVTNSGYENHYPDEISFNVEAESASAINKVTLRYKIAGQPANSSRNPDLAPGTKIKAQYVWNTQRQYVPPGVELQYYWQIEDEAGNRLQTNTVTFTVDDTRYQWQKLAAERLAVSWYKGDEDFAKALLDAGTRAIKQLEGEVGVTLDKQAKIFVYATQRDMLGALRPNGVEWVGGRAFAGAGVIVLNADSTPAGRAYGLRTVPHELSHLIVHIATDNPFGGVPSWLDEGLATYAEGTLPPAYQQTLNRAVAGDALLSLQSLTGNFPTDSSQSLLGYAESVSVVKYLLAQYGRDKMATLLGVFREGSTVDDALRKAYGRNQATIEAEWRTSIGAKTVEPNAPGPDLRATAVPAKPAPAATPSASSAPGGRSCFGGLLGFAGAAGGLLWLATRLRPL